MWELVKSRRKFSSIFDGSFPSPTSNCLLSMSPAQNLCCFRVNLKQSERSFYNGMKRQIWAAELVQACYTCLLACLLFYPCSLWLMAFSACITAIIVASSLAILSMLACLLACYTVCFGKAALRDISAAADVSPVSGFSMLLPTKREMHADLSGSSSSSSSSYQHHHHHHRHHHYIAANKKRNAWSVKIHWSRTPTITFTFTFSHLHFTQTGLSNFPKGWTWRRIYSLSRRFYNIQDGIVESLTKSWHS